MMRRTPVARFLTLLWASLQLAAPALSSIADGQLTRDNASKPLTHIESTSSDSCPFVHSPDCAVCRYISLSSANDASAPQFDWRQGAANALIGTASDEVGSITIALPHGRAPPTA